MLDRKTLQALGCWDGYKLDRVVLPEGETHTLSLYLKPVSKVMYCEECGTKRKQIHETTVRRVRDLPFSAGKLPTSTLFYLSVLQPVIGGIFDLLFTEYCLYGRC